MEMGFGFLCRMVKMLCTQRVAMVAGLYEHTKNHWIVHFKRMNLVMCELNPSLLKEKANVDTSDEHRLPLKNTEHA